MRGHIYASYWIGACVGLMVGAVIGFGIIMSGDTCSLRLPSVTMGGSK